MSKGLHLSSGADNIYMNLRRFFCFCVYIFIVSGVFAQDVFFPPIIFAPDRADFEGLPADLLRANEKNLDEIASVVKSIPNERRLMIVGNANRIAGTEKEEVEQLGPLSMGRANAVAEFLVKRGVDAARIVTAASGSGWRQAPMSRKDEAYANRRVEIVLFGSETARFEGIDGEYVGTGETDFDAAGPLLEAFKIDAWPEFPIDWEE